MSHTVVIAGAGPTGLMLASELALVGVDTIVVERRPEPEQRSRGMAIHGQTLELFEQRGLRERIGADEIFPWPRTPFSLLWLDLGTVGAEDHVHAFPQWRTEALLERRAVELGVDIRRGSEVTGFDQDEGGVTVEVASGDGTERVRADYLVGCDGPGSLVRERAGIKFPGDGETYHGVFGDVAAEAVEGIEFDAEPRPTGVFAAMPIEPGVMRLMTLRFGVDPPADGAGVSARELAESITEVTGQAVELPELRWAARFGGQTRVADRYRDGRVLIAGDAAHTLFISGTQGMHTGLTDAVNLGWKLGAVLNGWAPEGLLDTYEAERKPVGERMAMHARASIALLHPLEKMEQLRALISRLASFDEVTRHLLRMTTAVRYPMGGVREGAEAPEHPLLGARVPATVLAAVEDGARALLDSQRAVRGAVVDLSEGAADLGAVAGWADRVDVVRAVRSSDVDAAVLVVRPDGHVAFVDTAGTDAEGLRAALGTWFGEPGEAGR
ncbi:FAD-dependent monooxygenase [Nocardiopsis deserti]|uniref:FAD-dependent monooxygenase n=1 Tax=Nocardiopsis deserti TaxID=2605988 RepID=UPI00123B98B4|nr:FAD-dependent monooxygenase [Nocardiopsis deserti]